ncbi:MAG: hypothetical protein GY699_18975 [Desulfobacteraceae bacterium]|nr:hypothetical protein [Desulfobacteraceae bacterium]
MNYRFNSFLLVWAMIFFPILAQAQSSEKDYAQLIHREFGGHMEVGVPSGRVDILTNEYAIEVDWANKWKEAIGQALWYGQQTLRKPGIVLILKKPGDLKYAIQLNSTLEHFQLSDKIKVWIYPNDFKVQKEKATYSSNSDYSIAREKGTIKTHWMTISSQKRHNQNCRYFEKSKGRFCSANEGVVCKICGG